MHEENINEADEDKILFDKFKEKISNLCKKYPESIECERFKKQLERLNSFDDLKKM